MVANFSIANIPQAKIKRHGYAKPRANYVKLNVDGDFGLDLLHGSFGAVIRDLSGKFIAGDGKIDRCEDALIAEAMAPRFGVNLATTIGFNHLEVNSNNVEVTEMMKHGGRPFELKHQFFYDSVDIRFWHGIKGK